MHAPRSWWNLPCPRWDSFFLCQQAGSTSRINLNVKNLRPRLDSNSRTDTAVAFVPCVPFQLSCETMPNGGRTFHLRTNAYPSKLRKTRHPLQRTISNLIARVGFCPSSECVFLWVPCLKWLVRWFCAEYIIDYLRIEYSLGNLITGMHVPIQQSIPSLVHFTDWGRAPFSNRLCC